MRFLIMTTGDSSTSFPSSDAEAIVNATVGELNLFFDFGLLAVKPALFSSTTWWVNLDLPHFNLRIGLMQAGIHVWGVGEGFNTALSNKFLPWPRRKAVS